MPYIHCYVALNIMKEVTIKIQFDDEGGYKGYGDDVAELIKDSV